jgi:2-methylfumaryl-CoA isomerase
MGPSSPGSMSTGSVTTATGSHAGILAGMRVVEISAFVAVPLAGATLASLGADVIRIDPIGGGIDSGRWPLWRGASLYWAGLNQGKRSVTLDLRDERGQELVRQLVASGGRDGGLVLTNLDAQGGLSFQRLRESRPDVIMVRLTGNRDGSPAVDYTVNARVGFPMVTGSDPDGPPVNHVMPAWDGMAGHLLTTGLLAAERHRARTGEGQLVSVSLADIALAYASRLGIIAEAVLDPEPRRRDGNYIYGTFGKDFRTRDGRYVMIVALTPGQWHRLKRATALEDALDSLGARLQVDLDDEGERWNARYEIAALIGDWASAHDLAVIRDRFDARGVLWSAYQTFTDLGGDPEASPVNPMFSMVSQPGVGEYPVASTPFDFSDFGRAAAPAPPRLGEHTEAVLSEILGMSKDAIRDLRTQGIAG